MELKKRAYRVIVYKENPLDGDVVSDFATTDEGRIVDLLKTIFAINRYLDLPLALSVEVCERKEDNR